MLIMQGHRVRVLDRPEAGFSMPDWDTSAVERIAGSFMMADDVLRAVEGCEIVFHLASTTLPHTSNQDPAGDLDANVGGALKLFEVAHRAGVRRVVFASSGGTVYGTPVTIPIHEGHPTEPLCAYGISKLAIEKYLALYRTLRGLDYIVLRVANPFGPGQSPQRGQGAIGVFLHRALQGQAVDIWGDGSVVRDFLYIDDVCDAFIKAGSYAGDYRVFNVGSGHGYSLNEILDSIEDVLGQTVERRYLPGRNFDVPSNVLCIERARHELGWQPAVGLAEGLRRVVRWQAQVLGNSRDVTNRS
jgi:UDP-glucose 4-epimerase